MNFALSDDQRLLKDSAQAFLAVEIDLAPLRRPGATVRDAGYAQTWAKLAPLGWTGLLIPEEYGGAGLCFVDLVMIVEEMGRTLAPSPFLGTLLGTLAILRGADAATRTRLLPRIAAGELTLALAAAEPGGREEGPDGTAAVETDAGWRLSGAKAFVVDAPSAQMLAVAARAPGGERRMFLVDAQSPGVTITLEPWRDITRQVGTVILDAATAIPLGGAEVWPWVRDRSLVALSAESLGGLRHVLAAATDYAKQRVAFGRPIGAYQAIKHSLADMLGQAECASVAVLYAAWALAEQHSRGPLAAAMAKAYTSDAYVEATHRAIQIFGAIGFTWESENHLYFKRARCNAELFGPARDHRARVIDLVRAEAA